MISSITAERMVEEARAVVGKLFVADIGVPSSLYRSLNLEVTAVFASDTLIPVIV